MSKYASKLSPWRLSAAALVLLVAVVGLLGWQGTISAVWPSGPTFEPSAEPELSDDQTCANADILNAFEIPEGDLQFDAIVSFTPPEFYVPSLEESGIPIGADGGTLESTVTLGLIGGPCNSVLGADFDLLVCTVDTSPTVTFDEQFSKGQGSPDLEDGCEYYPDFLNTLFPDPPIYRLWGMKNVSGVLVSMNVVYFEPGTTWPGVPSFSEAWGYPSVFVLNDPTEALAPGSISDFCTPLVSNTTVFGMAEYDQTQYKQRENPCLPGEYTFRTWARTEYDADDDGENNGIDNCVFHDNIEDIRANAPGSDPDGDGIDSACDPDPDTKGWPEFSTTNGSDVDGDGYHNRQDNCPFIWNGDNADEDADGIGDVCEGNVPETDVESPYQGHNTDVCDDEYDDDGDTRVNDGCPADGAAETTCNEERLTCADANGDPPWDACDDDGDTVINDGCPAFGFGNPNSATGTQLTATEEEAVEIVGEDCCPEPTPTATATPGPITPTPTPTPVVDSDGDTVSDADEETYGSDPQDPNSTPESLRWDNLKGLDTCADGEDNDGDGDIDAEDERCADTDFDTFEDSLETALGSDPEDPDSTPEHLSIEGSCTDGADNDLDGAMDADEADGPDEDTDPDCFVAVVETPTGTAEVTPTPEVGVGCPPVFPGTYNGLVRIDGAPAADGYEVVATIGDKEWGSAFVSGGRYAVDIPQTLPTSAPCFEGGTLTFKLNGMTCTPSVEWAAGLQNQDLECAAPAAPPTATPTGPAATPSPATPAATPTATPAGPPPTGSGGGSGPASSLPLWGMALIAWAGLMGMAGLGILVRR